MSLPGAVLPGGFAIAARKTYGHVSDGMICSARELGLGDDHGGILVLDPALDGAAARRRRASTCSGCATTSSSSRSTPTAATRCRCAASPARRRIAYGVPFRDPALRDVPAPNDARLPGRASTRPDGCDRSSSTRTVTGLDPTAPTPRLDARRRLQLAGMRPISLAVDVTNYVMLELGQPMHAFDRDRLAGPDRRAPGRREGEKLTTLDGVDAHAATPRTC